MEFKDWLKHKMQDRGLNSATLADAIGENQPTVYRIITGETKNPRLNIIKKIEKYFDEQFLGDSLSFSVTINKNIFLVPLLDVKASMGSGQENDLEGFVKSIYIDNKIADKILTPYSGYKNLAFITAVGDSMAPTFNDGDILLIDSADKNVTADKVYVLEAHGRLFIKRVRQRIDGKFEISSDNPLIKTVDVLNGDHEVLIKGRVIWVWNGKKL